VIEPTCTDAKSRRKILRRQNRLKSIDGAIWAALGSNFAEKTSEPFSVEAVIRSLGTRTRDTLEGALNYIRQCPRLEGSHQACGGELCVPNLNPHVTVMKPAKDCV
jgi:hypothetical protein